MESQFIEVDGGTVAFSRNGMTFFNSENGEHETIEWTDLTADEQHFAVCGALGNEAFEYIHPTPQKHFVSFLKFFGPKKTDLIKFLGTSYDLGINPLPKFRSMWPEFEFRFLSVQQDNVGQRWPELPEPGLFDKPIVLIVEIYGQDSGEEWSEYDIRFIPHVLFSDEFPNFPASEEVIQEFIKAHSNSCPHGRLFRDDETGEIFSLSGAYVNRGMSYLGTFR